MTDSFDPGQRRAGLLLHPTSLPSGVLDGDVERWLDFMAASGFTAWQVLPLGEPQDGVSPYQSISAFAMNPGLLADCPGIEGDDTGFVDFCATHQYWLDDYTLFKVLKQELEGSGWHEWPDAYHYRDPQALREARQRHHEQLQLLKWQQYQCYRRWSGIHAAARDRGIALFGDMPIFVSYDSADVWANRDQFLLDASGAMEYVTGVPPDYFSDTGQRWGNPHYDWDHMRTDGFEWWHSRIRHYLQQFDLLRIDHFRGLEAVWMIEADCDTAIEGHWQRVPGDEMLSGLLDGKDTLPLVAEDLGVITAEVTALRKRFHLPGMSILQFGFDQFEDNPHKPHNIEPDTVVYTGTHDNDTTKGWFDSLEENVKSVVLHTLELLPPEQGDWRACEQAADRVVDRMIFNALNSRANLCMIPLQDYLHLGSEARMNVPGTTKGNWTWKFGWDQIKDASRQDRTRLAINNAQRRKR